MNCIGTTSQILPICFLMDYIISNVIRCFRNLVFWPFTHIFENCYIHCRRGSSLKPSKFKHNPTNGHWLVLCHVLFPRKSGSAMVIGIFCTELMRLMEFFLQPLLHYIEGTLLLFVSRNDLFLAVKYDIFYINRTRKHNDAVEVIWLLSYETRTHNLWISGWHEFLSMQRWMLQNLVDIFRAYFSVVKLKILAYQRTWNCALNLVGFVCFRRILVKFTFFKTDIFIFKEFE